MTAAATAATSAQGVTPRLTAPAPTGRLARLLRTPVRIQHMSDGGYPPVVDELDTVGYLEWKTEEEHLVEQETYIVTGLLVLPPGTPITARDQAVIGTQTVLVNSALPFTHARTGAEHHIECIVVEVSG